MLGCLVAWLLVGFLARVFFVAPNVNRFSLWSLSSGGRFARRDILKTSEIQMPLLGVLQIRQFCEWEKMTRVTRTHPPPAPTDPRNSNKGQRTADLQEPTPW